MRPAPHPAGPVLPVAEAAFRERGGGLWDTEKVSGTDSANRFLTPFSAPRLAEAIGIQMQTMGCGAVPDI